MEKQGIVRFSLGSMYLQIEDAQLFNQEVSRNVIIRAGTDDLQAVQRELRSRGVELETHDLDWGEIGFIFDPSGNKFEYFREK